MRLRKSAASTCCWIPSLNKSTAFTEAERRRSGSSASCPTSPNPKTFSCVASCSSSVTRSTDLDRYIYLVNLLDHDETLFYRTIMSDPARFLPIVYDPTIGEACLKFGHIFRAPRGMYLSIDRRGHVREVLRNWPVEGRPVHLRDRWRPHSWPWRPRRERHGHSDRQAATLHRRCRRAAAAA